MGYSKIIFNGVTKIDLTGDTVAQGNLLLGERATGADGEPVTGGIPGRSAEDLTVSGPTVTAPAGHYPEQVQKSVPTTTHPKPTLSLNSANGKVTASHEQGAGYVEANTSADTLQLPTKAAATITPSETEQEIAAGQYLLGKQTIGAIPGNYVGSEVPRNPTPTASGKTVTIPAGFYSEQQTKDVAAVEQATPVVSIDANGKISAKATQDAGYVAAGSKTGTKQLTKRTAADLSASGPTVTAPAGYYPEQVQKAVPSATQATPSIAVDANGLITATATQGAGYVAAGTKSATKQLAVYDGTVEQIA